MLTALKSRVILSKLRNRDDGNVALIFAVSLIPIFLLLGFAIDLQQVTTNKSRVLNVLDSVVIAGARELQDGKPVEEISTYMQAYFTSALGTHRGGTSCEPITPIINEGDRTIKAVASCHQQTSIMQLAGIKEIDFSTSSASTYGIGNVDIAFVFDISGSMGNSGKMDALKDAADVAVDVLLPAIKPTISAGEVRIGMASYSTMVDAGSYFKAVTNKNKTRTYTATDTDTVSTCVAYKKNGKTCKTWKDEDVTTTVTKTITNTCVKERLGTEAFTDADPAAGAWIEAAEATYNDTSSGGSWSVETCNNVPPLPLTAKREDLFAYIDTLNPNGMTAGHLGIAWGWYLIAPDWKTVWPSGSDPKLYTDPDSAKALILMTDGEFNTVYNTSKGNSFDQSKKLCDEIKKTNIQIYTVAFNAPTAGKQILSYCASGPEFAFEPESADELTDAYKDIAKSISDLRIAY